ncbi:MAG TPA: hypothetical protein VFS58_17360 [Steroidobacteraceae bacterium]|nr:hypothetical protein [Steroidobacteraceae bacterium]
MKYLAICFLSLTSLFNTAGAATVDTVFSAGAPLGDRALALVVAAALIALQLRRRQKSLRMPRQLN